MKNFAVTVLCVLIRIQIWLIDWQYWEARGLMVSALVPGTSGPGSSPAEYTVLCS